jgi:adenylate cyclase
MTEDIIAQLGRIDGLRVISRTTAMRYKATTKSIPEIGEELRVDAVLEGSVRISDDRVRITVRLIDTISDEQRWGAEYEREITDVFAIQRDIAQNIAAALEAELSDATIDLLNTAPTTDVLAYDELLRARHAAAEGNFDQAQELLRSAIQRDTAYAAAWAQLAMLSSASGDASATIGMPALPAPPVPDVNLPAQTGARRGGQADGSQQRAAGPDVTIVRRGRFDPRDAGAHVVRMFALVDSAHLDSALIAARNAVSVNPNDPQWRRLYANVLAGFGRHQEALAELRKAESNDPMSAEVKAHIGALLYAMDRPADAVPVLRAAAVPATVRAAWPA